MLITETPHGFVCANGGVDASNVGPGRGDIVHAAAASTRTRRRRGSGRPSATRFGVDVAGRRLRLASGGPWRWGIVDVAIGVSGLVPIEDLRGSADADGRVMRSTVRAVADEIASAAELALGQDRPAGRPPLVRGAAVPRGPSARR